MLQKSPRDKIIEFHDFLTGWFSGGLPKNQSLLENELQKFSPKFVCVTPTSRKITLEGMRNFLPNAYGNETGIKVSVGDFEEIHNSTALKIISYVEMQVSPIKSNKRISTAVFEWNERKGWVWRYLHETWIEP